MRQAASIVLICAVLVAAGCAATPARRWAQARELVTDAELSMITYHEAGDISDETMLEADPYIKSARLGLDRAYGYFVVNADGQLVIQDGRDRAFWIWMNSIETALNRLAQMKE